MAIRAHARTSVLGRGAVLLSFGPNGNAFGHLPFWATGAEVPGHRAGGTHGQRPGRPSGARGGIISSGGRTEEPISIISETRDGVSFGRIRERHGAGGTDATHAGLRGRRARF